VRTIGAKHPHIIELRRLVGRRSSRLDAGLAVVEGPKVLGELIKVGSPVQRVLYDVASASTESIADVIVAADRAGIPLEAVGRGVLDKVLDSTTPQGVAALVPRPQHDLAGLAGATSGGAPTLVAAGVQDPGNLGALVRVAAAAGSPALVCDRGSADPWAPKALRASTGWALRFPVVETDDLLDTLCRLRDDGVTVVLAAPGGPAHDEIGWMSPTALVMGSEGQGVDPAVLAEFPDRVSIPMAGGVESLNVATAAAVVAFEAARQARAGD
jgi:TrmH family RNA methyltransferase